MIQASDLLDKLLAPHATSGMVALANAWLVAKAKDYGVEAAAITDPLSYKVKQATVAYMATEICLAEAGQNQGAFGPNEEDVFMVKMKDYQKKLMDILATLTAADFDGGLKVEATQDYATARLYRG